MNRPLNFLLVVGIAVSACSPAKPATDSPPATSLPSPLLAPSTGEVTPLPTAPAPVSATQPPSIPTAGAQPPNNPTTQPPTAPPEEPPPVKQGLEATDPQTVNLSDGTPHLVEFFAFW